MDMPVDEQVAQLTASQAAGDDAAAQTEFFACWMDHALDTVGAFPLQLCAFAVAQLLASRHPALQQMQVRSHAWHALAVPPGTMTDRGNIDER